MYTTRKNIKTNEQNSNSNDKTNDSPRWGGKSILTSLINIEGTSVVIDGKDFDNLSFTQGTMWKCQGIQLPLKKFWKVMIYSLTWTKNVENFCKSCKIR